VIRVILGYRDRKVLKVKRANRVGTGFPGKRARKVRQGRPEKENSLAMM
jgi:hypothetical protein